MIPVLVVTGPIGVGKSSVLRAADQFLNDAATARWHATVELEDICRLHAPMQDRGAFVRDGLAALWSNFAAYGASRLLSSALVEQRSQVEELFSRAIPGAAVTVVRLRASFAELEQRLRSREGPHDWIDGELDGARWWTRHFEQEQPEDHVVETERRRLPDITEDVLRLAGWIV
jgi:broad-specificity NMP kinase